MMMFSLENIKSESDAFVLSVAPPKSMQQNGRQVLMYEYKHVLLKTTRRARVCFE